jgi:hypothetical protein
VELCSSGRKPQHTAACASVRCRTAATAASEPNSTVYILHCSWQVPYGSYRPLHRLFAAGQVESGDQQLKGKSSVLCSLLGEPHGRCHEALRRLRSSRTARNAPLLCQGLRVSISGWDVCMARFSQAALLTRSTLTSLVTFATRCKETQRHGHHADAEGYRCLQVRTPCIWTTCAIMMRLSIH